MNTPLSQAVSSLTLGRWLLRAYLWALLLVLAVAAAGYGVLATWQQTQHQHAARQQAEALAARLQAQVGQYLQAVEAVSRDPQLASVFQQNDDAALKQRQQALVQVLAAARVVLIDAGSETRWQGPYPRLSFAEQDMLLAARNGEQPRLEYHALPDQPAQLAVLRAVLVGEQIVGYVLASFDAEPLRAAVSAWQRGGARFEVLQRVGEESVAIVAWGDAALARGIAQDGERIGEQAGTVAATRVQWRYWQAAAPWQMFGLDWRVWYGLAVLLILGLLALMLLALRRVLQQRLVQDGDVVYQFVKDRMYQRWLGKEYAAGLLPLQQALQDIKNLPWGEHIGRGARDEDDEEDTRVLRDLFDADTEQRDVRKTGLEELMTVTTTERHAANPNIAREIFRAYDIRGIVGRTLTSEVAYDIGRAFGSEAHAHGEQNIIVGRDGRCSSIELAQSLIQGIRDSGRNVIDVGEVPTPMVYFATNYLSARTAVMVTGSHNPPDYNGFKLVLRGEAMAEAAIALLYQRIVNGDYLCGDGSLSSQDLQADYVARICSDVQIGRELKVVIDCGNGVAGKVAPVLLQVLGCEVVELNCEVDGTFPNHHPDPSQPENLRQLIAAVREHRADVGLAFDGDGDRIGVIDARGNVIWPDRLLMLFARHVLRQQPGGEIIYDVKSSRHLRRVIQEADGLPLMWKTGHSLLKAKLRISGALLAGELSGHIFFNDRWYGFDDALYASARLLEILSNDTRSSHKVFADFPDAISTPELQLKMKEGESFRFIERLHEEARFSNAELITIDGIRAEFKDGWGLVRASNTTPSLVFRFEADSEAALRRIMDEFRQVLLSLQPDLQLPF